MERVRKENLPPKEIEMRTWERIFKDFTALGISDFLSLKAGDADISISGLFPTKSREPRVIVINLIEKGKLANLSGLAGWINNEPAFIQGDYSGLRSRMEALTKLAVVSEQLSRYPTSNTTLLN